ncbi:glucosidase II beta subunit-like-domain-containing protein [Scheffersomyces xylosifermentans]|uniref:glucosidase II beta subunit-like-domain-containing protein n=1 Tax=Scheffersomyces xylosifermentans TaxID=1304137 RepID=UPI00315DE7E3
MIPPLKLWTAAIVLLANSNILSVKVNAESQSESSSESSSEAVQAVSEVVSEVVPETAAESHPAIIGVSPEDQDLYKPATGLNGQKIWRCLSDPSIVLSYDQINDDYCDCPDGSDEPGTNACPYNPERKFYCRNEGHIPGHIENYKLNDGVCDYDICCDGSDEYITGKCENKCPQIHQQFEEYKKSVNKDIEKSLQIKQQLIEEAQAKRKSSEDTLNELKETLAKKKAELERLKKEFEENKDVLEGEVAESVFDELSPHIEELSSSVRSYEKKLETQESKILHLEKILNGLVQHYNPNFNDAAVKDSVSKFQEYISNKEVEVGEELSETHKVLEVLAKKSKSISCTPYDRPDVIEPQTIKSLLQQRFTFYAQLILANFLQKPADARESSALFEEKKPAKSATEYNEEIESLEKEIKSIESEISIYEEDLAKDYGAKDILRAVASKRVNGKIGEYSYSLGFTDSISQDGVLIGSFVEFKDNKLIYKHGAKCWNGPSRSADVELICGPQNKLLTVSEPEKCEYLFELITPIVCENFTEEEILANFKIDYNRL